MRCTVVRNEDPDWDWWTIERVEHPNTHRVEPTPELGKGSFALVYSGRVCDADVEGPAIEMIAIARAIKNGRSASFKRCAAIRDEDGLSYHLYSPRNSMKHGVVLMDEALELAKVIETLVPEQRGACAVMGCNTVASNVGSDARIRCSRHDNQHWFPETWGECPPTKEMPR